MRLLSLPLKHLLLPDSLPPNGGFSFVCSYHLIMITDTPSVFVTSDNTDEIDYLNPLHPVEGPADTTYLMCLTAAFYVGFRAYSALKNEFTAP